MQDFSNKKKYSEILKKIYLDCWNLTFWTFYLSNSDYSDPLGQSNGPSQKITLYILLERFGRNLQLEKVSGKHTSMAGILNIIFACKIC